MPGSQTHFFAEHHDIRQLIEAMGLNGRHYQCFASGVFDTDDIPQYQSLLDMPNIGYAHHGDWNHATSVLVLPADAALVTLPIRQRVGRVRYFVDQLQNPYGATIRLGGILRDGVLVASNITTVETLPIAKTLYSTLIKPVKKMKRIGVFYVGGTSYSLLQQGWRLVANVNSPPEYDLVE